MIVRLDLDTIFQSAEIGTGATCASDPALRHRVAALVDWFNTAVEMTPDQIGATRRQIVQNLVRRLSIEGDIARHPEILEEKIREPIFVIGYARTGTTLLQSLLGVDPAQQTPRAWQVREPSPPPGAQPVCAYRLERATRDVSAYLDRVPGKLALHPYWDAGAMTEIEDEEIFAIDFLNAYPSLLYNAPALALMIKVADEDAAYAFLKRFLQHQQWKQFPTRRWITKGTDHQRQLAALFRTFPDARCIWPHREPGELLPSQLASAFTTFNGITNGEFDRARLGPEIFEMFVSAMDAASRSPLLEDPRVIHIRFKDIAKNPIAAIRNIYRACGITFSDKAHAAMRAWLDDPSNRSDRHGKHHYDLAQFGIDWAAHSSRFDSYRERFLIEPMRTS